MRLILIIGLLYLSYKTIAPKGKKPIENYGPQELDKEGFTEYEEVEE